MSRNRLPQILAYMTPFPYSVDVDAPLARVIHDQIPDPGPGEAG